MALVFCYRAIHSNQLQPWHWMLQTKQLRKTHQMRKCMWKAGHQCQCQQQLDRISKSCFCFDPSVVAPDLLQLSPVCSTHIYVTERGIAISWNAIKVISYFLSMFKGVLLCVFQMFFNVFSFVAGSHLSFAFCFYCPHSAWHKMKVAVYFVMTYEHLWISFET